MRWAGGRGAPVGFVTRVTGALCLVCVTVGIGPVAGAEPAAVVPTSVAATGPAAVVPTLVAATGPVAPRAADNIGSAAPSLFTIAPDTPEPNSSEEIARATT